MKDFVLTLIGILSLTSTSYGDSSPSKCSDPDSVYRIPYNASVCAVKPAVWVYELDDIKYPRYREHCLIDRRAVGCSFSCDGKIVKNFELENTANRPSYDQTQFFKYYGRSLLTECLRRWRASGYVLRLQNNRGEYIFVSKSRILKSKMKSFQAY